MPPTKAMREKREKLVIEHMESENRHEFDVTMETFEHPRYELIATGDVFDGEVEVECRHRAEVEEALAAGADRLLLDNMSPDRLRQAVAVRDAAGSDARLEASGGVTLDNVAAIAATGVEFISIGALTHSAPALDLSLLLDPF